MAKRASKKVSPKLAAKPAANRAERAAERRGAIIEAAMEEFISRGFAATRLDDIAKRAGVAKGTIYLHFKDKESMFEELIRTAIVPLVVRLSAAPPRPDASVRDMIEAFAKTFIEQVATTRRGDIVRLIVAEGPRFPAVADFYYREVVSRGLAGMRALIELGISSGEIQQQGAGALSADPGRARIDCRDLAEPFQQARASGRVRDVSCASRPDLWRTEDDMTSSRAIMIVLALARRTRRLQGAPGSGFSGLGRGRHDLRQPR